VARPVHLQTARHACADQARGLRVAVPPPVNRRRPHAPLRIRPQESSSGSALFGAEDEVVRLWLPVDQLERLSMYRSIQDDATAQRILPIAESSTLKRLPVSTRVPCCGDSVVSRKRRLKSSRVGFPPPQRDTENAPTVLLALPDPPNEGRYVNGL
jgi:hypothetical protein